MIRVGITGQSGFVGTHLFNSLKEHPEEFSIIPFEDAYFDNEVKLRSFVRQCDVLVHLAAMMRSSIEGEVYKVNMHLTHQLIDAMNAEDVNPCILFSSSIQEGNGSEYGRCKQEGRELLEKWAKDNNTGFVGMIFPNLYGPGARPNSHSFIATFCYKLNHGEMPQIIVDNTVPLKYIGNLIDELLTIIRDAASTRNIKTIQFSPESEMKVTEVLSILLKIKKCFIDNGTIPILTSNVEKNLFVTFKSYIYNGRS